MPHFEESGFRLRPSGPQVQVYSTTSQQLGCYFERIIFSIFTTYFELHCILASPGRVLHLTNGLEAFPGGLVSSLP